MYVVVIELSVRCLNTGPEDRLHKHVQGTKHDRYIFLAVSLSYNQYWPGGFMILWFLCPGTPEGSTGSSSG